MRTLLLCVAILVCSFQMVVADDLYVVRLHKAQDADLLAGVLGKPVLRAGNEYLVLGNPATQGDLRRYGLDYELILADVTHDQLALDRRPDDVNLQRYELVYEHDGLRVVRVDPTATEVRGSIDLLPLPERLPRVVYVDPRPAVRRPQAAAGLDSIVARVSRDSVESYLHSLQAFYRRVSGTPTLYAARDWLEGKFLGFGYDSVYLQPFQAYIFSTLTQCYNVVAVKTGTVYPDIQIVVGGHFDGVPGSPAADDNGSGTVGVLEIARALAEIETAVTIIFVAFDAEEHGLYGAWNYAYNALFSGENILFMFNMDMIGHLSNNTQARLFYGANTRFAQAWVDIAAPWSGIAGVFSGQSGSSDHYPFLQIGFDVAYLHEYYFSPHWHWNTDSTSYINFDYLTRMIKGSVATLYSLSESDDLDGDGVVNGSDNCLMVANTAQADVDTDGWGDACDNCADDHNPGQADADSDRIGDLCDDCMYDPFNDDDRDLVCGDVDNCPSAFNTDQHDVDGNGVGDACQFTLPTRIVTGGATYDSLGVAVAAGGDVNNDGHDDFMVGAVGVGPGNAGEAFVYSGFDGSQLCRITGDVDDAKLGWAVAIVSDLNGDGADEFMVGAPRNGEVAFYAGKAYLFAGASGAGPRTLTVDSAIHTFEGPGLADFVGAAFCEIDDIDTDGVRDLIVAAPQEAGTVGPGRVTVYSGASRTELYTVSGENTYDWFGHDVDAAGDFNNDGLPDFVVGAPHYPSGTDNGRIYVYSGPDGALLAEFTGDSTRGQLGFSVAGVGDVDSDGFDDIAAGAPWDERNALWGGYACIFSGQDSSVIFEHLGYAEGYGVGYDIAAVGDADGDSVPDFAISSWQRGFGRRGRADLFSGRTGGVIHTFIGEESEGGFGVAIAGRSDTSGALALDLVVGSYLKDGVGADVGRAYVFALGDIDQDGHAGSADNCPARYNPGQEDYDGDGQGDLCDACPAFDIPSGDVLVTGDANEDLVINASDIIYVVNYVFKSGPAPLPFEPVGDVDCTGDITSGDVIYLVNYVFKGGSGPCDVCAMIP